MNQVSTVCVKLLQICDFPPRRQKNVFLVRVARNKHQSCLSGGPKGSICMMCFNVLNITYVLLCPSLLLLRLYADPVPPVVPCQLKHLPA